MKFAVSYFIFITFWISTGFTDTCHPSINSKLPQYIIGYGSLINEQSKKNTDATAGENFPVILKGYQRSWSIHGTSPGLNTTFLAVNVNTNAQVNGVIYQLQKPENIQKYDQREKSYCRKEITANDLIVYGVRLPPKKQIWTYVASKQEKELASVDFPIVQSYVDVFLHGCMQIEEKFHIPHFAQQCITHTQDWPSDWVNDRIYPRRPTVYEPYATRIDALLKQMVPAQFKKIKFEKS